MISLYCPCNPLFIFRRLDVVLKLCRRSIHSPTGPCRRLGWALCRCSLVVNMRLVMATVSMALSGRGEAIQAVKTNTGKAYRSDPPCPVHTWEPASCAAVALAARQGRPFGWNSRWWFIKLGIESGMRDIRARIGVLCCRYSCAVVSTKDLC